MSVMSGFRIDCRPTNYTEINPLLPEWNDGGDFAVENLVVNYYCMCEFHINCWCRIDQ